VPGERCTAARQPALHRPDGQAQLGGDLFHRQVGDVVQHQHLPLGHRNPAEGPHQVDVVGADRRQRWRRAEPQQSPQLPRVAAVVVDPPAEGDRAHPRLGVVVAPQSPPAQQRAREGVLDHVLGLRLVVQEREQQPDQPGVGGREELLKARIAARVAALAYRLTPGIGGTPLSRPSPGKVPPGQNLRYEPGSPDGVCLARPGRMAG
jgi:hypothetical protein